VPFDTCPADWDNIHATGAIVKTRRDGKLYNARAGHDRNGSMLTKNPHGVIAFEGGRGTHDMTDQAAEQGILVWQPRRMQTA
jgi:hypothetical protein